MDELICLEVSPGTIRPEQCPSCNNTVMAFDTVALRASGVAFVGTIRRCTTCTEEQC